jgi:ABC-2 type transport system ATP-binding protein
MIRVGEKITVEIFNLSPSVLDKIKELSTVDKVEYRENTLVIRSKRGKNNIVKILECLSDNDITFGKIYSELPTLNDVFLEITGKELRD